MPNDARTSLLMSTVVVAVMTACVVEATDPNAADEVDQSDFFVFDMPDLMATIATPDGGESQLEAYKSVNNDRVMTYGADEDSTAAASQLVWVSVGHPAFVAMPDETSGFSSSSRVASRLFHFTRSGFHAYVEMLTPEQRHLLAATASNKYGGVRVLDRQVSNLILSSFECTLSIYDIAENRFSIVGHVTDFNTYPLRIDFDAPNDSVERDLFEKQLKETDDLQFVCRMASRSRVLRTTTLTIDPQQLGDMGLVDKLFGPAADPDAIDEIPETVCVTRQQLTELADAMYPTLDVAEEYRMSKGQFVEAFVDEMVERVSDKSFEMLPLDLFARSLSPYGVRLGDSLDRDQLIGQLKSILRVEELNGRRTIEVDEMLYFEFVEKYDDNEGLPIDRGMLAGRLGINTSIHWARNNSRNETVGGKTIDEQLVDLNRVTRDEVEWSLESDLVVPKHLRAAVFGRSQFEQTLTFKRVHREKSTSAFETDFSLYTLRAVESRASMPNTGDPFQTSPTTTKSEVRLESEIEVQTVTTEEANTNEQTSQVVGETTQLSSTVRRDRIGDDSGEIDG